MSRLEFRELSWRVCAKMTPLIKRLPELRTSELELLEALIRAADTFADIKQVMILIGKKLIAESCAIAEDNSRVIISKYTEK